MKPSSAVISLAVAACSAVLAGDPPQVMSCPVSIEIPARVFTMSHEVRPNLRSHGPRTIYLSGKWPRGFRVERQTGEDWTPIPADDDRGATDLQAVEYRFREPSLVAIVWRDVASRADPNGFAVPPGRYRFVLRFALTDPSQGPTDPPRWCTVRSAAFTLEKEQTYTTWE